MIFSELFFKGCVFYVCMDLEICIVEDEICKFCFELVIVGYGFDMFFILEGIGFVFEECVVEVGFDWVKVLVCVFLEGEGVLKFFLIDSEFVY